GGADGGAGGADGAAGGADGGAGGADGGAGGADGGAGGADGAAGGADGAAGGADGSADGTGGGRRRGRPGRQARQRAAAGLGAVAVLAAGSLPWLIPSLARPVYADPAGVAAFAARADTPFGSLGSLVM